VFHPGTIHSQASPILSFVVVPKIKSITPAARRGHPEKRLWTFIWSLGLSRASTTDKILFINIWRRRAAIWTVKCHYGIGSFSAKTAALKDKQFEPLVSNR
jgi:hypothetical protein